ncbi:MAG: LytR/AlgR family response regulator transcription factor [Saprospiraceae bacterium]
MDLRVIIVEDEENSRIELFNMLSDFCKNVSVIAQVDSIPAAIKAIQNHQPDVVLLNIEMPGQNGFKLFDYFPEPEFEVIFTTAYDQYAVKAFRLSAADYLLKPIDLGELRDAIKKVKERRNFEVVRRKINVLKDNLNNFFQKLALPTTEGFIFVEIKSIIRCEASGNYTHFYLQNKERVIVSKTLKVFTQILEDFHFFRISRSHLINLNFVKKYGRQKNPTITMEDGSILSLSENRKNDFLALIEQP